MPHSSRLLWLPAFAVVVPCVFIAVLGFAWLGVEREAADHRRVQAAQTVGEAVSRDLQRVLEETAQAVGRAAPLGLAAPFESPLRCAGPCSAAFLFNRAGELIRPVDDAAVARRIDAYRRAIDQPEWKRAIAHLEDLERRGEMAAGIAAATKLLEAWTESAARARLLVMLTRLSANGGLIEVMERHARAIAECCAADRDELGNSFVLYASWVRMRRYDARQDPDGRRQAELAGELRGLVDRGYLGSSSDVTTIELLSEREGGHYGFGGLAAEVARAHARFEERGAFARGISAWIRETDFSALGTTVPVRPMGHGAAGAYAALIPAFDDRVVAIRLDRDTLESWVVRWERQRGDQFDLALLAGNEEIAPGGVELPLFHGASPVALAVRGRRSEPQAESARRTLLGFAIGGGLALTLVIAVLAGRDVSRELRTASLRSAFVSSVTHELKTPLASIRLLAETLRLGRARPELSEELLDTIIQDADRLARLVDNVLSSSRIESGTAQYHPHVVSLPDVVRYAIRQFDVLLKNEGFELVQRIDENRLPVNADPDALKQVVLNLLANAMKYSGTSRRIEVSVARQADRATLSVADQGIGIAPADQGRVFDRFYRTREAIEQTTGAGLGLALVRHFADAHGGRVDVRSNPGIGSVFALSLPIASSMEG